MRKLLPLLLLFTLACSDNTPTNTATAYVARGVSSQTGTGSVNTPRDEQIRGNRRSMIYHWPGCPNYNDIGPTNRVYFKTRTEAEAAGYRAARNCS
jgi:hypothetical protein